MHLAGRSTEISLELSFCCCDLAADVACTGELWLRGDTFQLILASYECAVPHRVDCRPGRQPAPRPWLDQLDALLHDRAMAPADCRLSSACSQQRDQQQQQLALPAGLVAGAGAMLAHPLVAEAGVTPSLKNLLFSVVAGGFVLSAIAIAVTGGNPFRCRPTWLGPWSSALEAMLHGSPATQASALCITHASCWRTMYESPSSLPS